jgi:hypothetical protein
MPDADAESETEYAHYLTTAPNSPEDEEAAMDFYYSHEHIPATFEEHMLAVTLADYFK